MDETEISVETSVDKANLMDSIQTVVVDIVNNLDYLQYHDYKFEENFKSEVYQSFQTIKYEDFDTLYHAVIVLLTGNMGQVWRSHKLELHKFDYFENKHETQIEYLKHCLQPEQRTKEWYVFRNNHLTGSNLWKIFGTISTRNQLYYEKISRHQVPVNQDAVVRPNLNDQMPMNWGHKYEPVSILLYEYYNDVTVEEFGCIEHTTIPYLAASPDGIVTSKRNNGRMIEVKNPTTRDITQIPKMDYYVQMQIQMEVCDLDGCDFVETKFKEYETYNDYKKDKYKIEKGLIVVLIKDNVELVYEYMPLFNNSEEYMEEFTECVYKKYGFEGDKLEHGHYKWFKNIYWKLDIFSCVYVPRNKKWFSEALPKIQSFWENIIEERNIPDSYLKYKANTRTSNKTKQTNEINVVLLD
jgi:putative phage-type endonuclease